MVEPPSGSTDKRQNKQAEREHRLWGGRYEAGPAKSLDELNRSLPMDQRLWQEDIRGSRAWAQALQGAGVLSPEEAEILDKGLQRVADRIADGAAHGARDEDIHTLVERLLFDEVGTVAGKLHTGRSRNDQVATDSRLWALNSAARLDVELRGLQKALVDQAEATVDLIMPAYTHLRRAQPVRLAHWLLAHFWALERDRQRVADMIPRIAVMPLGSGAIAGCPFPVDREALKDELGFLAVSPNSLDAVGDRDWVAEFVFVAALIGVHLSRLAEDLIVFSSQEFGFVQLPEAYTTGSSLLPQKRNPDGLELARGKAARLIGILTSIMTLLKGLPTGYQKDLQEDKPLLFDAVDTLCLVVPVTRETVGGLKFDPEVLNEACSDVTILATDLADHLVRQGVPFRTAHEVVGKLFRRADELGVSLSDLPEEVREEAHPALQGSGVQLDPEMSVEARAAHGGTARSAVEAQIEAARAAIA